MIIGAHSILYSTNAEADRAFLRDVLGFHHVDVGRGWLIFALPPGEVAIHPSEEFKAELYLMTDDVSGEIGRLKHAGVVCSEPTEQPWGILTSIRMPSGMELGLYQPKHPTAF